MARTFGPCGEISVSGSGLIGVQRGVSEITGTTLNVAVNAVDVAKSFLTISWSSNAATSGQPSPRATLTTSTNIELTRSSSSNSTFVSWNLVEFE